MRCSSGSPDQKHIAEDEYYISLWKKGNKKVKKGARQGPKMGAKTKESGNGKKRDMSKVKCFFL
jgi:hypothetical protein